MHSEDVCGSLYGSIKKSKSDNHPQCSIPVRTQERECNFERIRVVGGVEKDLLICCLGMQKKVTGTAGAVALESLVRKKDAATEKDDRPP